MASPGGSGLRFAQILLELNFILGNRVAKQKLQISIAITSGGSKGGEIGREGKAVSNPGNVASETNRNLSAL